jgi:hypothetical protein
MACGRTFAARQYGGEQMRLQIQSEVTDCVDPSVQRGQAASPDCRLDLAIGPPGGHELRPRDNAVLARAELKCRARATFGPNTGLNVARGSHRRMLRRKKLRNYMRLRPTAR